MPLRNLDSAIWEPLSALALFVFWELVTYKLSQARRKLAPRFHVLRLVMLIAGIAIFIAWQHGFVPEIVGFSALGLAFLFMAVPEVPYYANQWFRRCLRERNKIWRGDDPGNMRRPLG